MLFSTEAALSPSLAAGSLAVGLQGPFLLSSTSVESSEPEYPECRLPPVTRRTCKTIIHYLLLFQFKPHIVSRIGQIGSAGMFVATNIELR